MAVCMGLFLLAAFPGRSMAAENLIDNYSFEFGTGTTPTSWSRTGEVGRETWAAQHLTYGMGFYGWMPTGGSFYQDISCSANHTYYYRICSRYELNYRDRIMEQSVTFYNASMTYLSSQTNYVNTASFSNNAWYTNRVETTAPANAAFMRVMFRAPNATPMTGPNNRSAFADNIKILGHTNDYRQGETVEAFPYDEIADNPLHGKNWGHGFSGAWQESNPGSFVIADINLGQVTGYPDRSGVKTWVNVPNSSTRTALRPFTAIHTGKLYFSYMLNYQYSGTNKWAGLSLMNGSTEQAFVGKISSHVAHNGLTTFPGATNYPSSFIVNTGSGNDYLIVGKYDFTTRRLSTKGYYQGTGSPIPSAEPSDWHVTTTLAPGQISQINGIQLNAGGNNTTPGNCYFDELRIATNWWDLLDVTPQDPTQPASGITFSNVSNTQMTVSWTRGNGENVLVACRAGAAPIDPSDASSYTADSRMGYGSNLGSSSYVVYSGSASSITVSNLSSDNTYYFSIYEYNGAGSAIRYATTTEPTASQSTATGEINLLGRGQTISDNDYSTSIADGTDFGSTIVIESNKIHTFTIENIGAGNLILTDSPYVRIYGSAAFSMQTQPPSGTISGASSNTFAITFAPSSSGTHTALVSIANNDSNENPYTFAIEGNGTKRILYVTADDFSKDYGSANPLFTLSYSNWYTTDNSSDLTSVPTASCPATANSPTGHYSITASGGIDEHYSFHYTAGTLSITNGLGNAWHVPASIVTAGTTMRNPPTNGVSYMQPVVIYTANQNNDGTQTNAILYYRRTSAVWLSSLLTHDTTQGTTHFWKTEIAPDLFGDSDNIEYYIELQYQYNLATFIGTTDGGLSASTFSEEADARSQPFTFIYAHNNPPVFTMESFCTLAVGSSTDLTVQVTDADGSTPTLSNPTAPSGSSFNGTIFSWNAGSSDVNSSNLTTFVADDQRGLTNSIVTNSIIILVPFDSDSDQMSDGWEWDTFTSLAQDETTDFDGDGATDYHEYIAGTTPTSSGSLFSVNRLTEAGGPTTYELEIPTQPGKLYTIEYRDGTLGPGASWSEFTDPSSGIGTWTETNTLPATFTFTDDFSAQTTSGEPTGGYRIYRIRVE